MDHGSLISEIKLKQLVSNFRNNRNLPFTTDAAAISLEQLESYIAEAKTKYSGNLNGFRIYFIRYPLGDGPAPAGIGKAGNNLSQPSVVFVPLKNYDAATGAGEDSVLENPGDLYVLSFGDPAGPGGDDSTALCPPKCG